MRVTVLYPRVGYAHLRRCIVRTLRSVAWGRWLLLFAAALLLVSPDRWAW
jgi:hypothetical protein